MKFILIIPIISNSIIALNLCEKRSEHPKFNFRIVGGSKADSEFNWMAKFVSYEDDGRGILCGATVIDKNWLLTAAHCAMEMRKKSYAVLTNPSNKQLTIRVREAIIHPKYNNRTAHNDVALLKVSTDLFKKGISAICLVENENALMVNYRNALVLGFGISIDTASDRNAIILDQNSYLQQSIVPIIPQESCRSTWQMLSYRTVEISSNQLCAGSYLHGTGPGDSGGPLLIRKLDGTLIQVGITSFGADGLQGLIDQGKYPGVYTRVSKYIPWIEEITSDSASAFNLFPILSIFYYFIPTLISL